VIQINEVLVVVPAYNEAATLEKVVAEITSYGFLCLVVDDGSSDGTPIIAGKSGAEVLSLLFNVGVGGAMRCGFRYAVENGYKAVIQFDADGQHIGDHLKDLLAVANNSNAHYVLGSRFRSSKNTHDPHIVRRFAMWCLSQIASHATGQRITDSTSGFRLIRMPLLGELAKHLPNYYLGDTFVTLVVIGRSGYSVEEIGVAMAPRQSGVSTANNSLAIVLIFKACVTLLLGSSFRRSIKMYKETQREVGGYSS
jgi:glycosyltransferase involved in cell wall biosynthesis